MTHPAPEGDGLSRDELRRLSEAATQGEWKRSRGTCNDRIYASLALCGSATQIRRRTRAGTETFTAEGRANAELVAAAVNELRRQLAEPDAKESESPLQRAIRQRDEAEAQVEGLRVERDALRAALESANGQGERQEARRADCPLDRDVWLQRPEK